MDHSRRKFVKQLGVAAMATSWPIHTKSTFYRMPLSPVSIQKVNANFEREPLRRPFGFKGGSLSEIWQTASLLESDKGTRKVGLGVQSVLWSDASVFAAHSENGGNALMFAMTEYALQLIKGQTFENPIMLLDDILEEVYAYGKKITGNDQLRKTFALNALVGVDNAAWLLYAADNGAEHFDRMIPEDYRPSLSHRHTKVASIPALGYGTPMDEIKALADEGYFIMKIKIGAPGDQQQMLEKDKAFLKDIHETIGLYETPHTEDGKIPYYFDANGRYDSKDTLLRFLDYADKIKALDQIALVEEPFGERNKDFVGDIGVVIAADESAHTDEDAKERIEQGYGSIAVKAVAKTLSMTLKIVKVAHEQNIPCFCADLTVNPILVEWNKVVAARLAPFKGMNFGLQETNGHQNYRDWDKMKSYHPHSGASWTIDRDGVYPLGEDFYEKSGGIFDPSPHYDALF